MSFLFELRGSRRLRRILDLALWQRSLKGLNARGRDLCVTQVERQQIVYLFELGHRRVGNRVSGQRKTTERRFEEGLQRLISHAGPIKAQGFKASEKAQYLERRWFSDRGCTI